MTSILKHKKIILGSLIATALLVCGGMFFLSARHAKQGTLEKAHQMQEGLSDQNKSAQEAISGLDDTAKTLEQTETEGTQAATD